MKLNKLLEKLKNKTWIIVTVGVLVSGSLGLKAMTSLDKSVQEDKTAEVVKSNQIMTIGTEERADAGKEKTDKEEADEVSSTIQENSTPENRIEEIKTDLGEIQIKYEGKMPEEAVLSGEEAFKIALDAVLNNDGQFTKVPRSVVLNYVGYKGILKEGRWRCLIQQDEKTLYVVDVDCADKKVNNYSCLTREQEDMAWHNEKSELICEEEMPKFSKINLQLKERLDCKIIQDDHFAINLERERKGYELHYEIKDNTLFIKEEIYDKALATKDQFNVVTDALEIRIPSDICLEEIVSESIRSGMDLDGIKAEKVVLSGANAGVECRDCKLNEVSIDVVNISTDLKNNEIGKLDISGANGACEISQCQIDEGILHLVNGSMTMGKENTGKISADVVNGTIMLEEKKEESACEYNIEVTNGPVFEEGNIQNMLDNIFKDNNWQEEWEDYEWEGYDWRNYVW